MTAPALLTEAEAAKALHLCPRTLRKERKAGRLRYVKVGRAIRYSPDDLAAFIDASRQCNAHSPVEPPKPTLRQRSGKVIPFSERERNRGRL